MNRLLCPLICWLLLTQTGLQAQPCTSQPTDTVNGIFPDATLPDMEWGVQYMATVRLMMPNGLWVQQFYVPFDSFGLDNSQTLPAGIQLDCPMNPANCMAYPDSSAIRLCLRFAGAPTVQYNPNFPDWDTIAIRGTFRSSIPTFAVIPDTFYFRYRIHGEIAVKPLVAPGSSAFDLQVSPNPAVGQARLSFHLQEPADLSARIVDALGRQVWSRALGTMPRGGNVLTIDLSALLPGHYVFEIQDARLNRRMRKTVVVSRP